jgi:hypothetical protein
MILTSEKLAADEDDQLIYLGRFAVYVDGVFIGIYDVYLEV